MEFLPKWLSLRLLILFITSQDLLQLTKLVESFQLPPPVSAKVAKVDGWLPVTKRWPLDKSQYFIATEKGHHFIETKLPRISTDLKVSIDYYYSYGRTKPLIQIVPCKKNVEINNKPEHDLELSNNGRWFSHSMIVKREDCERRNELAYNIILHDPNDVFAWSSMTIETYHEPNTPAETPINDQPDNPQPAEVEPARPASPEANVPSGSNDDSPNPNNIDGPIENQPASPNKRPLDEENPAQPESPKSPIAPAAPVDARGPDNDQVSPPRSPDVNAPATDEQQNREPKSPPGSRPSSPSQVDKGPNDEESNRRTDDEILQEYRESLFGPKPARPSDDKKSAKEQSYKTDQTMDGPVKRIKRDSSSQSTPFKETCRPDACDRGLFKHSRFLAIMSGLPQETASLVSKQEEDENRRLLLATNRPLEIKLTNTREKLMDSDICFNLNLFMDADTRLKLALKESAEHSIPLETIERGQGDSGAGSWSLIKRCITDYMPRIDLLDGPTRDPISLVMEPEQLAGGKRIAFNLEPKKDLILKPLEGPLEFLPDFSSDKVAMLKGWNLGPISDGGPRFMMEYPSNSQTDTNSQVTHPVKTKQSLNFAHIPHKNKQFELTSKWLRITDIETLEYPLLFQYSLDKPDWLKSVQFELQKAGEPWRSNVIYTAAEEPTPALPSSSSGPSPTGSVHQQSEIVSPMVRLKGLKNEDFRVRIRHNMKDSVALRSDISTLHLKIHSLSLGDVCSDQKYCSNGGTCRPFGAAKAQCICLPGYSGRLCEKVKPCEVHYNGRPGKDVCESIGAKCVEKLPVFRCLWPNDEFFQCKALYQSAGESGELVPAPPDSNQAVDETAPLPEQLARMKERVLEQEKLIIILGVFMAALVLFATVIIFSMVGRLMKSKRRLQGAQGEVHELSRRTHLSSAAMGPLERPSISGPISQGRPPTGRGKPTVLAYSNQAFDQ